MPRLPFLVFALRAEAGAFFRRFAYRKDATTGVYLHASHALLIAGVGQRAAASLQRALHHFDEINYVYNLGCAFSPLHHLYKRLEVLPVQFCANESGHWQSTDSTSGGRCLTVAGAIGDVPEISCDMVDMEAFHLLQVSRAFALRFYASKIISDFPGEQARQAIASHLGELQDGLLRQFMLFGK